MEKLKNSNNKIIQILMKTLEINSDYSLTNKSALITYYLLLSIGPFLVLMFGILSIVLSDNVDAVVNFFTNIYEDADVIVEPILSYLGESSNSTFALIGLIATLFSSSKASRHLLITFDEIFSAEESEGIKESIKFVLLSMGFTVALIVSIIIFFILFVTGDPIAMIVDFLTGINLGDFALWNFIRTFLPVIYLLVFLSILYKFVPKLGEKERELNFKETLIGSIFVTLGWIIGSSLFSFYIQNINKNNAMYGALGSIMVLMLWFFILIYMLLLGGALIKSSLVVKKERERKAKLRERTI